MRGVAKPSLHYPRVTIAYANSLIDIEKYDVDHELCIVTCRVRLKNSHRFTGEAIVANSEHFDIDRGKSVARKKVIDKIMEAEMYLLRTRLYEQSIKGE